MAKEAQRFMGSLSDSSSSPPWLQPFLWTIVPAFSSPATPVPSFCVCFLQQEWDAVVQRRARHLCSTGPSIAPSRARGRHHQSITAPLSPGPRPGHLRLRQPLLIDHPGPEVEMSFLSWGGSPLGKWREKRHHVAPFPQPLRRAPGGCGSVRSLQSGRGRVVPGL